ncbi:eukaryotic translation initiation factor 3 subunit g1 [Arctopsyche grandis]|uniref:eukaryotic translation initiation factor 3 subunit g1 n=1 Tax=Arctopsyche grandis TaxID=121162 RepID=UPI00406D85F7
MPGVDEVKSSWADEMEADQIVLPPSTEVRDNDLKIVTEYKLNEFDKKVKVVRTYKIEKRTVSKSIASRKNIPKFGDSSNDKPGPNPATTLVGEDVYLQYITSREESTRPEESELEALKANPNNTIFKCRTCQGDHWTVSCPFKHLSSAKPDISMTSLGSEAKSSMGPISSGAKYVAPSLREGARRDLPSMNALRRDDTTAIRISNLSDSTVEADLEDLVKLFGPVQKLYLAKEKSTGQCKGFAYVHFKFRNDAAKAIQALNGHGYDHLILSVDWSKPPANQN